ncbi:hypothetical protein AB0G05_30565 [Nonomuraea wenchangensis]
MPTTVQVLSRAPHASPTAKILHGRLERMRALRIVVTVLIAAYVIWAVLLFTLPVGGDPIPVLLAWIVVMGVLFGTPAIRSRLLGTKRS